MCQIPDTCTANYKHTNTQDQQTFWKRNQGFFFLLVVTKRKKWSVCLKKKTVLKLFMYVKISDISIVYYRHILKERTGIFFSSDTKRIIKMLTWLKKQYKCNSWILQGDWPVVNLFYYH